MGLRVRDAQRFAETTAWSWRRRWCATAPSCSTAWRAATATWPPRASPRRECRAGARRLHPRRSTAPSRRWCSRQRRRASGVPEAADTILESGLRAPRRSSGRRGASGAQRPPRLPSLAARRSRGVRSQRSAFLDRLVELSDSIEGDIEVVEVQSDVRYETLVRSVARGGGGARGGPGEPGGAAAELLHQRPGGPLRGPAQPVVWGVRRSSPELLEALNAWLGQRLRSDRGGCPYRKYFIDRRGYRERVASDYSPPRRAASRSTTPSSSATPPASAGTGGCWPRRRTRSRSSIPPPAPGRARRGCCSSCRAPRGRWA